MSAGLETAPGTVRFCTNCAMVESVHAVGLPGAPGSKPALRHEVVVRFGDGKVGTFAYDNDPGLKVGDKVKVSKGVLVLDL